MRNHPEEAWQQAFGEAVAAGQLPAKIDRGRGYFSNPNIVHDGAGNAVFEVPYSPEGKFKAVNQAGTLVDKGTNLDPQPDQSPYANLPANAGPARPGATPAPAPAPTAQAPQPAKGAMPLSKPAGAAFAAPPGMAEGGTGTSNGVRYMNRGGWMFPVAPVSAGR
jgi:hypothetical protein